MCIHAGNGCVLNVIGLAYITRITYVNNVVNTQQPRYKVDTCCRSINLPQLCKINNSMQVAYTTYMHIPYSK